MPVIETPAALYEHVATALSARSHWLLLAPESGHAASVRLGLLLYRLGVPDSAIRYTTFEFRNAPTRQQGTIVFFSCPKTVVAAADFRVLLKLAGFDAGSFGDPERDVLVAESDGRFMGLATMFLTAVASGSSPADGPSGNTHPSPPRTPPARRQGPRRRSPR